MEERKSSSEDTAQPSGVTILGQESPSEENPAECRVMVTTRFNLTLPFETAFGCKFHSGGSFLRL